MGRWPTQHRHGTLVTAPSVLVSTSASPAYISPAGAIRGTVWITRPPPGFVDLTEDDEEMPNAPATPPPNISDSDSDANRTPMDTDEESLTALAATTKTTAMRTGSNMCEPVLPITTASTSTGH